MKYMAAMNIIRRPRVLELTGWSTSTLYEKMSLGRFPRPVKLDPEGRAVGWIEQEIEAHQKASIAARDSAGKREVA
jgi:prophage regulatory protein